MKIHDFFSQFNTFEIHCFSQFTLVCVALTPSCSVVVVYGIKSFFSYFALLSFLIPMSLMVTLEVVKGMKL